MPRARAIQSFVVWTISVILASVFLLAGVPKLIGIDPVGLEAAAMSGFPAWIRIVVGVLETAGAIGLLIPGTATVAAGILAFLMIPATVTQLVSGQPGAVVPIVIMALLLFIAWWRNAKYVSDSYHGFADVPHPLLHDGVIAGLIGASVIAVWFFVIDLIAGHPFYTPATLGRGLIAALGTVPASDGPTTFVLVYTVFHFAAFIVVGLGASLIVFLARKEPSILLGFVMLFAATEVGVYGLVNLLENATPLGRNAWFQIMAGNLLAALAMGVYFWRTHKELPDEFRHSLDWPAPTDEDRAREVAEAEVIVVTTDRSAPTR